MVEHIRAGKVKALATTGKERSSVLPDVPTVAESGVPGYEATIWLGLMAPRGTPRRGRRQAQRRGRPKSSARPEVRRAWAEQGTTPMVMSIDEFRRYLDDDIAKWARIVKISGAKPDQ